MGRKPRAWSESGFYHVTARGNNRQRIFRDESDFSFYLRLCGAALATYDVQLHHYCLMPNHIHLLLNASTPVKLVRFMHQVQRRYWFHMRRTYRFSGHLWQGRYHSFSIETESYLLEAGRYIERNPLQAGMVTELESYPWSSYGWYADGKTGEITLSPSPGYLALGETAQTRQEAYRRYISTTRPYDLAMSQKLAEVALGA